MSQYLPRFFEANTVTVIASAAITGGQLVTWGGAVAGSAAVGVAGVAGNDAASGQPVTVFRVGVHTATSASTIAQGDPLCSGASGVPRTWVSGTDAVASRIGTACAAATSGNPVTYALFGV